MVDRWPDVRPLEAMRNALDSRRCRLSIMGCFSKDEYGIENVGMEPGSPMSSNGYAERR